MVKKRFIAAVVASVLISCSIFAANVPALKGRVNDYAKIIRESDEREIEEYLAGVEQASGIQIAVLTMPSLDGEDISSFGIRVTDKWALGDKEKDNGAILIVAYAEHDLRIEVGDGLEGSLTDAKCGLILRNVIVPEFRDGNYSKGILEGVKNMGAVATGDESAVSRSVREGEDSDSDDFVPFFAIIVWLIFFVSMISAGARRNRRRGRYYHNGNTIAWIAADAALRSIMRGSGGGGHSHSSGGFGGGFSGGGGHFSGGGASAHW